MTAQTKRTLEVAISVVVAIVALSGALKAWVLLPSQVRTLESKTVPALERDVRELRANLTQNRELLLRIDERLQQLQRQLEVSR